MRGSASAVALRIIGGQFYPSVRVLRQSLMAPYRAILRYYRCDFPAISHIARYFLREVSTPPIMLRYPPWYLVSHKHICAIPHFATYRAIIVRYPIKRSTREFCDTIATSIARYGKYRCWASKRQRSGEGVVRRNVCAEGCSWRVRFFFAP